MNQYHYAILVSTNKPDVYNSTTISTTRVLVASTYSCYRCTCIKFISKCIEYGTIEESIAPVDLLYHISTAIHVYS